MKVGTSVVETLTEIERKSKKKAKTRNEDTLVLKKNSKQIPFVS